MSHIVDHLADLTNVRDRDLLDVSLVAVLKDALSPVSITVARLIGRDGEERWVNRACSGEGDAVTTADPVWAAPETLPTISEVPSRLAALSGDVTSLPLDQGLHLTILPLRAGKVVVGVIEVETREPLSHETLLIVSGILRFCQNFQALLDYSECDTLTGLLNRKTFDESFYKTTSGWQPDPRRELSPSAGDSRRQAGVQQRCWLGLIDIDRFKMVNDQYGHLIGDEVLLLLAQLMRKTFRAYDRLYRFGGEEFVVLMRCGTPENAALALERLRAGTEAAVFPQVGHITISIGLTEVLAGDGPSRAFERADKAVYYAKAHGRNQVHSYVDLVARGELAAESNIGNIELFAP